MIVEGKELKVFRGCSPWRFNTNTIYVCLDFKLKSQGCCISSIPVRRFELDNKYSCSFSYINPYALLDESVYVELGEEDTYEAYLKTVVAEKMLNELSN